MSNTPHELAADFPDLAGRISDLRQQDAHFCRLADRYHEINREVHRAETNVEPMDDMTLIALRKERISLKDEIYGMLTAYA